MHRRLDRRPLDRRRWLGGLRRRWPVADGPRRLGLGLRGRQQQAGAGEVSLNSIDRDGMGGGDDLELISSVAERVAIPVIACGGVGDWGHLGEGLEAGAAAVSAANIFHYTENSVRNAKQALVDGGFDVRAFEAIDVPRG